VKFSGALGRSITHQLRCILNRRIPLFLPFFLLFFIFYPYYHPLPPQSPCTTATRPNYRPLFYFLFAAGGTRGAENSPYSSTLHDHTFFAFFRSFFFFNTLPIDVISRTASYFTLNLDFEFVWITLIISLVVSKFFNFNRLLIFLALTRLPVLLILLLTFIHTYTHTSTSSKQYLWFLYSCIYYVGLMKYHYKKPALRIQDVEVFSSFDDSSLLYVY
jgi:hypothetical protein